MNHQAARAARHWRKSSYSQGANDCVEITALKGGHHAVRDSKNPSGPALTFTAAAWGVFTASVRADEFD